MDIVGKDLRDRLQSRQGARLDRIIQPRHGLASRQELHRATGGRVDPIYQGLPTGQILFQPVTPRGRGPLVKGHLGTGTTVETVPGFLQIELHIRVGGTGQLIKLGHGLLAVAPFQVIGQGDCLGHNHRIHRRGEPLTGIDPLGAIGMLPVVAQWSAIDDLGLNLRRYRRRGCRLLCEKLLEHLRIIRPKQRMPHHHHRGDQGLEIHVGSPADTASASPVRGWARTVSQTICCTRCAALGSRLFAALPSARLSRCGNPTGER